MRRMGDTESVVRRRSDGAATQRRVLDAVVETIAEVGYYKASSNEIARRAGVTWGAIHHLFGSREQLMFEVFADLGDQNQRYFAAARIEGATLEERLRAVLDVIAGHYEEPSRYLVETQIMLDFSSNPRVSDATRREMRHRNTSAFADTVEPLLAQALGQNVPRDLHLFAFTALQGYAMARVMLGFTVELPDDTQDRELLIAGIASAVRSDARRRNIRLGRGLTESK
jgi:AcrR family transcriptional regulator